MKRKCNYTIRIVASIILYVAFDLSQSLNLGVLPKYFLGLILFSAFAITLFSIVYCFVNHCIFKTDDEIFKPFK